MAELCRDLGVEVRYGASVTTRVTEDGVHFVYAAENDEAGDRGGTEGKKGFLAVDLVVCSATETILRSERTDNRGGRRQVVPRDVRLERRARLQQRRDRFPLVGVATPGGAEHAQRIHERQRHERR